MNLTFASASNSLSTNASVASPQSASRQKSVESLFSEAPTIPTRELIGGETKTQSTSSTKNHSSHHPHSSGAEANSPTSILSTSKSPAHSPAETTPPLSNLSQQRNSDSPSQSQSSTSLASSTQATTSSSTTTTTSSDPSSPGQGTATSTSTSASVSPSYSHDTRSFLSSFSTSYFSTMPPANQVAPTSVIQHPGPGSGGLQDPLRPSNDLTSDEKRGLGGGAIAGIVLGTLSFALLIAWIVRWLASKYKPEKKPPSIRWLEGIADGLIRLPSSHSRSSEGSGMTGRSGWSILSWRSARSWGSQASYRTAQSWTEDKNEDKGG